MMTAQQIGRKGPLLAALAVSLAACTPSLTERDMAAGVSLPPQWTALEKKSQGFEQDGWVSTFKDQRLVDLVTLGHERNPDLRIAAARMAQADASARVAFADRLPSIDAQFAPSRIQSRFTAPNGQVGVVRQNTFALTGNLNWELDVWGRVAASVAAADADLVASKADMQAARLSLGANMARTYFDVITSRELSRLALDSVNSFERSLRIVESRYRRGITNALDVRLAANSLESARALQVQRAGQLDENKRRLEVLLANYPAAKIDVARDLPSLEDAAPSGIPSDILSRRPDIRASYLRLAAADYRVAEAKRNLLPSFTIQATSGNQNESFTQFLDFNSLVKRFAGNITQPLFQGGRVRANLALNKARADEALATYTQTLLTAFQEVETALAAETFLKERELFLTQAVEQAAAASKLAEQQYSRGLTQILNLLDAQRRELDSRNQLIDIRSARVQNRVTLYLSLGGPVLPAANDEEAPL
jgi:NodT family efflux transporter outer membrane factor (OMF) lipoprotein